MAGVRNHAWHDNVALWSDSAEKIPLSGRAHHYLALAYYSRGDFGRAEKEYLVTLSIDPGSEKAHNDLGAVYEAEGDLVRAEREFRTAISMRTGYGDALNNLAGILAKKGEYEDAVRVYQEALRVSARRADLLYNLSLSYEGLKMDEKAIDALTRAIALSPCHTLAHIRLGKIYERRGSEQMAEEEFMEARACDPGATVP